MIWHVLSAGAVVILGLEVAVIGGLRFLAWADCC